ncbi:DNA helicase [Cytobacillus oceanisediminis]|uniref:DISARM system helicase DrmA n=1 Tax=Cytobacillus oceanisediminis TaxID=665099 RepID=UPI001D156021|nr:DISARM system helicase DrmA [Cytobacillus oceanisediminis]MCC3646869.1 DNA helicase [Cytobacillus oceanisediminis]
MGLTQVALKIHKVLEKNIEGLNIEQLAEIMKKEVSPYLKANQIEKNLKGNPDVFICTDSNLWRLQAIVENEQKQAEVQKIIDENEVHAEEEDHYYTKKASNHEFSELREEFIKELENDLIGPRQEDELLSERPNTYYLGGMLYPINVEVEDIEVLNQQVVVEEEGKDKRHKEKNYDEPDTEDVVTNLNRFQPSSIGLTCNIMPNTKAVKAVIKYGKYKEVKEDKKKHYQRFPISETIRITFNKGQDSFFLEDNAVECRWIVRKEDNRISLSVFLVNRYHNDEQDIPIDHILFQPKIILEGENSLSYPFLRRDIKSTNVLDDPDVARSQLLYRNKADFAIGHGCAVEWNDYDSEKARELQTTFLPNYEVPAVEHLELKGLSGLDMYVLAYIDDQQQLKEQLMPLHKEFDNWINEQKEILLESSYEEQRENHINLCNEAAARIKEGIVLVCDDPQAFEAFRFANEMMLYQRSFSMKAANYRKTGTHGDELKLEGRWRPFQLAFILLNIKSVLDPTCKERNWVDLLWFPTGGGKTEAYLGLASFVMALRRLRGVSKGVEGYAGTTILMRYTLRLLTIQQFQRASALICAAEFLRSKNPDKWGTESFSIGLWVGGSTTPNQLESGDESAKAALIDLKDERKVYGPNPIQLHNCPACGEELTANCYNIEQEVLSIYCPNEKCFFHENTIPAYTVDEAIYYKCPTILIGTVDKFARLPWNGKIATLFGKVDRYCERHGFIREGEQHPKTHQVSGNFSRSRTVEINPLLPPELVIQDEFHLISGPLGSMVGLYETAIDYLSTNDKNGQRVLPKVVASTATIRRADKQVEGVFNRDLRQFPPSGVDAEDSFFSYEVPNEQKPGRKYIGLCFPGSSGKTSLIRIYASLLQKGYLSDEEGKNVDPYWTLAGYFNSLRELGGALRLVEDDIPDRIKYLVKNKEVKTRRLIKRKEELTSRIDATDIPKILNKLELPYKNEEAVDVLLSTNMISVGVDIDRLGVMVVTGQPKSTSEYIQATSRVGRKFPGLVITLFNWSRPRDISHYEQFIPYHSKFYAHVEATSVTPFSYRSRDKGLRAVVIGMLRQLDARLYRNSYAKEFSIDNDYIQGIKQYVIGRCIAIDKVDSENIEEEIDEIFNWWFSRVKDEPDSLSYQQYPFMAKKEPVLFRSINQDIQNATLIPDSLRDVEAEVDVYYTFLEEEE